MPHPDSTRWSLIHEAAEGGDLARTEFARRYEVVIRTYLLARWRGSPLRHEVDDAAQDVFVECFRVKGALQRADSSQPGGFRAFLYGVVRNIARRTEKTWTNRRERQPRRGHLDTIESCEEPLSRVFDRAWALSLLGQAVDVMEARARGGSESARRRVDLLRLRFGEELPIREIARRWDEDPQRLHYHYGRAREEFKLALREVIRVHDATCALDEECARLLEYVR